MLITSQWAIVLFLWFDITKLLSKWNYNWKLISSYITYLKTSLTASNTRSFVPIKLDAVFLWPRDSWAILLCLTLSSLLSALAMGHRSPSRMTSMGSWIKAGQLCCPCWIWHQCSTWVSLVHCLADGGIWQTVLQWLCSFLQNQGQRVAL